MNEPNKVLKINTALSNKPFFVNVTHLENPSLDTILTEAVSSLKAQGKPLEADQLAQLAEHHQMYNGNKVHTKGTLFNELARVSQNMGDQTVEMAELNLITAHAGGSSILNW
jgi:hypothetical protein